MVIKEICSKIGTIVIDDTPACTNGSITGVATPPVQRRPFRSRDRSIPRPAKVLTCNLSVPLASQQPPITRVCRILREELLSYYYETKIRLSYRDLDGVSSNMGKWLRAIESEHRHCIGTIGINTYPWMTRLPDGPKAAGALEERLKEHWKVDLKVGLGEPVGLWRRTGHIELL